jgi:Asp-tRNA(Asn)/Glu-tRNA(Gln) amidotransferase A subunit family amidase
LGDDVPDTCLVWTLCRAPAVNVPAFRHESGLPFGAQVVSRRYNDYLLLDFCELLDRVAGRPGRGTPVFGDLE